MIRHAPVVGSSLDTGKAIGDYNDALKRNDHKGAGEAAVRVIIGAVQMVTDIEGATKIGGDMLGRRPESALMSKILGLFLEWKKKPSDVPSQRGPPDWQKGSRGAPLDRANRSASPEGNRNVKSRKRSIRPDLRRDQILLLRLKEATAGPSAVKSMRTVNTPRKTTLHRTARIRTTTPAAPIP